MGPKVHIHVTVVYSPKAREVAERKLRFAKGSTVADALAASGLFAESAGDQAPFAGQGIWGKKVATTHVLHDMDRVELYRSLTVDPKVARRERFVRQGAKKSAGLFARRRDGAKAGY